MLKKFIIILIVVSSFFIVGFTGSDKGYTDYKKLAKDYAKALFNYDTARMMHFCSKNLWLKVNACKEKQSGEEGSPMGDLCRSDFRGFFNALYAVPAAKLYKDIQKSGITYCKVDSVMADKENINQRPCADVPYLNIHIYISYNKTAYETNVSIAKYLDNWYILYITPDLHKCTKPAGECK